MTTNINISQNRFIGALKRYKQGGYITINVIISIWQNYPLNEFESMWPDHLKGF